MFFFKKRTSLSLELDSFLILDVFSIHFFVPKKIINFFDSKKKKMSFSTNNSQLNIDNCSNYLCNNFTQLFFCREGVRRAAEPGTRFGADDREAVQRYGHVQLRGRIPVDWQGPPNMSRHRLVVRSGTVLQTDRSVRQFVSIVYLARENGVKIK